MSTITASFGVSAAARVDLTIDPTDLIRRWRLFTAAVNRDATGGAVPYSPLSWERFTAWAETAIGADARAAAIRQIVETEDVYVEEGPLAANLIPAAMFHELMAAADAQPGPGQLDIFGRQVA